MKSSFEHVPHVALQEYPITMPHAGGPRSLWTEHSNWKCVHGAFEPMTAALPRTFFIQGTTRDGKTFRPSDWAERLAGAMSSFRPEGSAGGIASFIGYSPLCVPRTIDGVRSVRVDETLRTIEPMAWDFVMNFARDNDLVVVEVGPVESRARP